MKGVVLGQFFYLTEGIDKVITRTLLGCLLALCLGFVSGCGGGSTETEVIESTAAQQAATDADDALNLAQESEDQAAADAAGDDL